MPELINGGRFKSIDLSTRFWSKVDKTSDCWNWTGNKQEQGYGRIRIGKRFFAAHNVAYYLKFGEWQPIGYDPDHTCKNPSCVKWAYGHLESIPHELHVARTSLTHRNRGKTHCIRGHSRWALYKNGTRYCMDCNNLRGMGLL